MLARALSTLFGAILAASAFTEPSTQERLDTASVRDTTALHGPRSGIPSSEAPRYSVNWAGAILHAAAESVWDVAGTFTIPALSTPVGGDTAPDRSARVWVGIDGDTCASASVRLGYDLVRSKNGAVRITPWYHAQPGPIHFFDDSATAVGASVTLAISATSSSDGMVYITDNTRGTLLSAHFATRNRLCRQDAEWVVENVISDGALVPLVNFTAVTFTEASAVVEGEHGPAEVGPGDAQALNMFQTRLLTDVAVGASSVHIAYLS
ncbi:peptidase G1 domain-containing protein [Phanerochaete sordida]|uniref:Peptidase G1 domain-containing protein n=1 Tax=Phanerochaete sordida TaxID=48140 RepID=A0A9P3GJ14_9APHY|nr:peptidase G1 domain-containing protein [Phanerochaete sordida]